MTVTSTTLLSSPSRPRHIHMESKLIDIRISRTHSNSCATRVPHVSQELSLCHGLSRSRLLAGAHPSHQHVSRDDPCRLPGYQYQISRAVSRRCEVALATTTCHEKLANHLRSANATSAQKSCTMSEYLQCTLPFRSSLIRLALKLHHFLRLVFRVVFLVDVPLIQVDCSMRSLTGKRQWSTSLLDR